MPKKGETLHSSVREIIYKVIQFCQREKEEKHNIVDLNKVTERVAAMTGLSISSVARIKQEGAKNTGVWCQKRRGSGRPKKILLNDSDKCAIKNKIQQFYTVRNEVPTLRKLHRILKEDNVINFKGGISSLHVILKELGFQYKKCQTKDTANKEASIAQAGPKLQNEFYHSEDLRC